MIYYMICLLTLMILLFLNIGGADYCCIINGNLLQNAKLMEGNGPSRHSNVESMSIQRGYYIDTSKNKFRGISTSFPRTFLM